MMQSPKAGSQWRWTAHHRRVFHRGLPSLLATCAADQKVKAEVQRFPHQDSRPKCRASGQEHSSTYSFATKTRFRAWPDRTEHQGPDCVCSCQSHQQKLKANISLTRCFRQVRSMGVDPELLRKMVHCASWMKSQMPLHGHRA